jgi:hypothetical protein
MSQDLIVKFGQWGVRLPASYIPLAVLAGTVCFIVAALHPASPQPSAPPRGVVRPMPGPDDYDRCRLHQVPSGQRTERPARPTKAACEDGDDVADH